MQEWSRAGNTTMRACPDHVYSPDLDGGGGVINHREWQLTWHKVLGLGRTEPLAWLNPPAWLAGASEVLPGQT